MYPLAPVNDVELASTNPIATEFEAGVKDVTEAVVEPAEELPVEVL
jgi:hypothetical protein